MTTFSGRNSFRREGINGELFIRPLRTPDLEQCTRVEHSAFPPAERFSQEAGLYRLTEFPEICLGLFLKNTSNGADSKLVGHVIATRERQPHVTEESMSIPEGWKPMAEHSEQTNGHTAADSSLGTSVAVHSLAIDPEYQKNGLGPLLMSKYTSHLIDQVQYAQRIVILAHGPLIKFYENLGFTNDGESACAFANGGWYDMTLELR